MVEVSDGVHPMCGELLVHTGATDVQEEYRDNGCVGDAAGLVMHLAEMLDVVLELLYRPLLEVTEGDVHGPCRPTIFWRQHVSRDAASKPGYRRRRRRPEMALVEGNQGVPLLLSAALLRPVHAPTHGGPRWSTLRHLRLKPKEWSMQALNEEEAPGAAPKKESAQERK